MSAAFRCLRCLRSSADGCWLEDRVWLPNAEQSRRLRPDEPVVVFVRQDSEGNSYASMKLEGFLDEGSDGLHVNQGVELLFFAETDLGFKAVVDNRYLGVLYHSHVFGELRCQQVKGYIHRIRPDGKLDLMLQPVSVGGRDALSEQILEKLQQAGGELPVSDDSPPEEIYERFGVSKKKFKMALGQLFKQGRIELGSGAIRLAGREAAPPQQRNARAHPDDSDSSRR